MKNADKLLDKWCKNIYDEIIKNQRKIVLVTGASSSGKSVSSKKLAEYCNANGVRAFVLTTDNYYKGHSRNITEKLLMREEFSTFEGKKEDIISAVREVIEFYDYDFKFSPENMQKLEPKFLSLFGTKLKDNALEIFKHEHEVMNFDEPFAIDFVNLASDINLLINKGEERIYLPQYSFVTTEVTYDDKYSVSGDDYDVFIVEGLYVLRKELLDRIPNNTIIKSAIDCDLKTILARKFNRDILNSRNSFAPERNIVSFLTMVMPAYYDYVYPTINSAEFIYNSSLTDSEINQKKISRQIKFCVDEQITDKLTQIGASRIHAEKHKDYFIEDSVHDEIDNIILRTREIDGEAVSLTIKIDTKRFVRPIEEYDLRSALSQKNREINTLNRRFVNSGFDFYHVIRKNRETYKYQDCVFYLDMVDNLGYFLEFTEENILLLNEVKQKLGLKKARVKSYYELYLDSLSYSKEIETELKFKVEGFEEQKFIQKCKSKSIAQYYLDWNSDAIKKRIAKIFSGRIDFAEITEARIRIVNSNDAYITLKSKGSVERVEIEKELPLITALDLIKNAKSKISKTRYEIHKSEGIIVELDQYNNLGLVTMEVEFDNKKYTKEQAKNLAYSLFDSNIKLSDVSLDPKYKNHALSSLNTIMGR